MKIAIIGAGASGLAALRYSLKENHHCTIFEKSNLIGGTWNYTDQTNYDEYGLPIHSSMYQGLKTNLPKEIMEFEDFPYKELENSFIGQAEVLNYIQSYAEHYNLYPHIRFLHHAVEISPLPEDKWKIKTENLKTKQINEDIFDSVMICIGNYSAPKLPTNIEGMNFLKDSAIHSHNYRKSDPYVGKNVLIIGAGPSGSDIAKLVGEVAKKVYISYKGTMLLKTADYVIHKPVVKKFESNGVVVFDDDSKLDIDNVIYCTGKNCYKYYYPFLSKECDIRVENNWIKYLYKHIINVEHPTMGFIGTTFRVSTFPTCCIQARFFLEFLKNPKKISKDEMMLDILKDVETKNCPPHQVHKIGTLHQFYFDDLADTVKIPKAKPVIHKLFQHLFINVNKGSLDANYRIINDEEFIQL